MVYTRQALAQSSAEAVLRWRMAAVPAADDMVDLTGGLGMDSFALSRRGQRLHYVERSPELLAIARHNHRLLGATGICHRQGDAGDWQPLPDCHPDLLFVDPDRRAGLHRAVRLEDCEPDVLAYLPRWRRQASAVWLKLSPAFDLSLAVRQLQPQRLTVVSVNGQVKELLVACGAEEAVPRIEAVLLNAGGQVVQQYSADWAHWKDTVTASAAASAWQACLYEPDPALIKAGLIGQLLDRFGLRQVKPGLAYLTGPETVSGFPGRAYRIDAVMPFQRKQARRALRRLGIEAVQVHRRDFPWPPTQIYDSLGLRAGDQADLFFTRDAANKLQMLITQRNF